MTDTADRAASAGVADDSVLGRLRDHVRAERADDAALLAVARGETGGAQVAALEQRAAAGDLEALAMIEASRPLDDVAMERIAKAAVSLVHGGAKANADAKLPADAHTPLARGRVVAFMRRAAVIVAPLAVAAAMFVYLGRGGGTPGRRLPDYAITASGEKEMRGPEGSEGGTLRLRAAAADASFELLARPASSAAGAPVVAYVFAIGQGEPSGVEANVEIAPEGSVRIRGRSRALRGAREVRVVIAPVSGSIKGYEDARARARDDTSDEHVRVLAVKLVRE